MFLPLALMFVVGSAEAHFMKHVADAKSLISLGKGQEALEVLENLLSLAPQNHEALRLKALILDSQGRFDESLGVLRDLSRHSNISDEALRDLERRTFEEREVTVYSELTPEGRWYFAFPALQVWISLYGFFGCAAFLLLSPGLLGESGAENIAGLVLAFLLFVATPWLALMVVHCVGIKRILVGIHELRVCTRFSQRAIVWKDVHAAVVSYSNDTRNGTLFLSLFRAGERTPLVRLNVSARGSVVKARRHFVRSVLAHVDSVSFVSLEASRGGMVSGDARIGESGAAAVQEPSEFEPPARDRNEDRPFKMEG